MPLRCTLLYLWWINHCLSLSLSLRSSKFEWVSWTHTAPYIAKKIKKVTERTNYTWWRHQMETFSALLAICAGNSPASGEFPAQRPMTRSFGVLFDLSLNKWLRKQSWGWWFETLSHPLRRHCNDFDRISYDSSRSFTVWAMLIMKGSGKFKTWYNLKALKYTAYGTLQRPHNISGNFSDYLAKLGLTKS